MDTIRALELTKTIISPSSAPALETFDVPNNAKSSSKLRARVRAFAQAMEFTDDQLDEICIAVGEASTNAIKHGQSQTNPNIHVQLENRDSKLIIRISDSGPGFDPETVCPPCDGDLCECGRGILCMRLLMDELAFHQLNPGTCVEMKKYLTKPKNPS